MTKYYNNINDCPLDVFKKVQLDNDTKHLLVSGEYDEEKAKESWLSIIDEYQSKVKSNRNNTISHHNLFMQR